MSINRIIPLLTIAFILAGGITACKDDPVAPGNGGPKDSCDTCICDTCHIDTTDTTDTVIVSPNDTTSHAFVWTEYSIPIEASITGCWVFDDNTIWAISNRLYTFESGDWIHKPLKNQKGWDLNSGLSSAQLYGFAPNDAWILYGGILWHYDGEVAFEYRLSEDPYRIIVPGDDGQFRAAWGTSSNDMFFVGDKGTIVHFDGTNWKKFPKVTEKKLQSVWGTASNDVYACGFDLSTAETILLHYDGITWSEVDVSQQKGAYATGGFNTVWTIDSSGHKVTVTAGAILIKRTDNGTWRSDSGLVKNRLADGGFVPLYTIRGNSSNDVMLAGTGGWIGHWNGSTWYQYLSLYKYNEPGYTTGPMAFKGNTAVLAGKRGGNGFVAIGRRAK